MSDYIVSKRAWDLTCSDCKERAQCYEVKKKKGFGYAWLCEKCLKENRCY